MAEGFLRAFGGDRWETHSAGLDPQGVNPKAIEVMREIGIDISRQSSKGMDPRLLGEVDMVITLCGNSEERCPLTPPSVARVHWPLEDPAKAVGTPDEVLDAFRRIRDEIRRHVEKLVT